MKHKVFVVMQSGCVCSAFVDKSDAARVAVKLRPLGVVCNVDLYGQSKLIDDKRKKDYTAAREEAERWRLLRLLARRSSESIHTNKWII